MYRLVFVLLVITPFLGGCLNWRGAHVDLTYAQDAYCEDYLYVYEWSLDRAFIKGDCVYQEIIPPYYSYRTIGDIDFYDRPLGPDQLGRRVR